MQNFSFLAWKMSELLTSEAQVDVEAEAEVKTKAKYS